MPRARAKSLRHIPGASSGRPAVLAEGPPVLAHSDVWGNLPEDYLGMTDPTGTDGNLAENPRFMDTTDPDPAAWDLHPRMNSPLLDGGSASYLDPDGSTRR